MTDIVYKRTGLTGGTANDLDGIDGNLLSDGQICYVDTDGETLVYRVNATSGATENSTTIIAPDANPGTKRWILQPPGYLSSGYSGRIKGRHFPKASGITDHGAASGADYLAGNLRAVVDEIGTDNAVIELPPGVWNIGTGFSIPQNITLAFQRGAVLTLASGVILTIYSPANIQAASAQQIFDCGPGGAVFSVGGDVWVNWFETNSPATDMTDALESAVLSIWDKGGHTLFLPETYIIGDLILADSAGTVSGPELIGRDNSLWADVSTDGGTILRASVGANFILKIGDYSGGVENIVVRAEVKNIAFDGNSNASDGLWGRAAKQMKMERVVFYKCKSAFIMQECDRLQADYVSFYYNTYAVHYDSSIHDDASGVGTTSAFTLNDCHHRSNDYNLRLVADRTSLQGNIRGGYWSSANTADIYITGAAKQLIIDGVNFENTGNGTVATKSAFFQIGQVSSGDHIGIDLVKFCNCYFQDNNDIADRPPVMSVVDSTDTVNPSIRNLIFEGCVFRNMPNMLLVDATTDSQVGVGFWVNNNAFAIHTPEASNVWRHTHGGSTVGTGVPQLFGYELLEPRLQTSVLNRTASFTARLPESGGAYTNTGASGTVDFTLPAVELGLHWYFVCTDDDAIRITPDATESFINESAGAYKQIRRKGSAVLVQGVSTDVGLEWAWLEFPLRYEALATWDPVSIAAGSSSTTTITVTGALVGDYVSTSFSLDLQEMVLSGHVSASDTVKVVLFNPTAGAIDLDSGTVRVRVERR